MPELRKDPIIGRWVIVATKRARRPHDLQVPKGKSKGGFCPFCEGNEKKTPPEVYAVRNHGTGPDEPGWRVRVVPNKFPVLQIEGEVEKRAEGMYDRMHGLGAHEVFIETPEHLTSMTPLPDDHVTDILSAYQARLIDLQRDGRMRYGMLFKNVGLEGGASLEHTHSQLIVTPVVPARVDEEINGARRFYEYRDRCVYCDILDQELSGDDRIVMTTDHFVAIAPYASRFPFETWILPRRHESHFERSSRHEIEDLAFILKRVLKRIEGALDCPPLNYMIHTAPFNVDPLDHYHWHIEIIPRVTRTAGFEWGTGFYINPVPPEAAAEYLRNNFEDAEV
jgi:UDPglucose--hexose-1-phosphate uridylyltransferase